ncbi:MAG: dienelactone hydrolase family protein [Longimicrobiales bacterium]
MRQIVPAALVTTCLLAACDGAGGDGEVGEAAAVAEGRIALAPTPPDSLPAAVLGTAPAPRGVAVHYFEEDSATTGYLALPAGTGPFPGVVLVHEWDGVVDRIKQFADALAAEGYAALVADVFSGRTGSNPDENMALVNDALADTAALIRNLDAAAGFLRAHPAVGDRIAAIGWCFGGGIALSYGLGGEHHAGTAIFYGRLITDPQRLAALDHELYGTFAGRDESIPPAEVDRFVEALRQAGIENDVHIYDDVDHGFWLYVDRDPDRFREPARDAWQRLKAYLVRTLR